MSSRCQALTSYSSREGTVEPKLPLTLQLDPSNLANMPEKTQGFTEDQVEDFKEVFQLFDTKGDGLIQVGGVLITKVRWCPV